MPQPRRHPGFAQKTKPRRFITEISLGDDFQRHGAVQIDVERLVGHPHRAATQLDRVPVFARDQLIVLESSQHLFCCRLEYILRRRLAGLNPVSKSLAKNADWTEFHCSRKLTVAGWTGASVLHFHGLNRPSDATRASQTEWISSSISAGSDTVRATSSRKKAANCFRSRWI